MTAHIQPAQPQGVATVPPSKSMAHRLLIGAALAQGASHIGPVQPSADIIATIEALRQLGATLQPLPGGGVAVTGVGALPHHAGSYIDVSAPNMTQPSSTGNNTAPPVGLADTRPDAHGTAAHGPVINCGESASTLRFLLPVFSVLRGGGTFTGSTRLFARPMGVYRDIFAGQGLGFAQTENSITVCGRLAAGGYRVPGNVSSQFISGLLWALPLLQADSRITILSPFESHSYVALTRAAQALHGVHSTWESPDTLVVPGRQHYHAGHHTVEGDWTQGALLCVLAAVAGHVSIAGLPRESLQGDRAILDILQRCGVGYSFKQDGRLHLLPPQGPLQAAGDIDLADCPDLGPALCVLGAFCQGETRLINAHRLRGKESDRLAAMGSEMGKLGFRVTAKPGGLTIVGGAALKSGQRVCAHGDHRVAMALAVAAVCGRVPVAIAGAEAVHKSWPGFWAALQTLGIPLALDGPTAPALI